METLAKNNSQAGSSQASVQFITMAAFKDIVGTKSISLRRNPKTNKLFAVDDKGTVYFATNHVEGDEGHAELDPKLPVTWRVEDDDYANACLVNGTEAIAEF